MNSVFGPKFSLSCSLIHIPIPSFNFFLTSSSKNFSHFIPLDSISFHSISISSHFHSISISIRLPLTQRAHFQFQFPSGCHFGRNSNYSIYVATVLRRILIQRSSTPRDVCPSTRASHSPSGDMLQTIIKCERAQCERAQRRRTSAKKLTR